MTMRQCVILVGGLGSRLGALTREVPKPMLPVAGRPFLDHLLIKAGRQGFERVLLLAGHRSQVVQDHLATSGLAATLGLAVSVSVEAQPLGTAGALIQAGDLLDDVFLLINGDTWFDFDWRDLDALDAFPAVMALRRVAPADRYETVRLEGQRITALQPRDPHLVEGLINGGAYRLTRQIVPSRLGPSSLESDLLPDLCARGQLAGRIFEGAFIDIGLPASLLAAQTLLV
jgi:D-glycero-alpha-D-manno-heptose 1-phosphate guanylyltransferase